jgi:membrane-associated phospholipid phosphatase
METLQQLGIDLILVLQTLSPALDVPMAVFSFLGTTEFYLLLMPLVYWVVSPRLGLRVFLIATMTPFLVLLFKVAFHEPRPSWLGEVQALAEEDTYGIPSFHSALSLAVWGHLAAAGRRPWLWALAAALIVLIALSRMYVGVHFPHDLIFGWLIGAAVLWFVARRGARVVAWLEQPGLIRPIAAALALSLALIAAFALLALLLAGAPDPPAWAAFAAGARSLTHPMTLAGALFGGLAGYSLMRQKLRFEAGGPGWQRAARYVVGIAGVLLIAEGLDAAFGLLAEDTTALGYALRYVRYALAGVWITFGAPWVFGKLRLTHQPPGLKDARVATGASA